MTSLEELVRRTDRLRDQVELLRHEANELRQELLRLADRTNGPQTGTAADSLTVALALARDLGAEFSSEQPHDLAERGNNWFVS